METRKNRKYTKSGPDLLIAQSKGIELTKLSLHLKTIC